MPDPALTVNAAPEMTPVNVKVLLSVTPTVLAAFNAIALDKITLPVLVKAPALPTPWPFKVNGTVFVGVTLLIFKVAPDETVTLVVLPNAPAFAMLKVPAITCVVPV